jgi:hypothetical protein
VNADQYFVVQPAGKREGIDRKKQAGREGGKHKVDRNAAPGCFRK